ncbi:MAG: DNA-packaging protein [Saprospiraceae bacterium]|nr:DNA-packaging protein [Saprospiraceae bacterium]
MNTLNFKVKRIFRKKKGKKCRFSSPEHLWQKASEYFEYCKSNPLYKSELINGQVVRLRKERPLTNRGLCLHLRVNRDYLNQLSKRRPEFRDVVGRIKDVIYNDQYTGAVTGMYEPKIISLNLKKVNS